MFLVNEQVYKKLVQTKEGQTSNLVSGKNINSNSIHINHENKKTSNSLSEEDQDKIYSNGYLYNERPSTPSNQSVDEDESLMDFDTTEDDISGKTQKTSNPSTVESIGVQTFHPHLTNTGTEPHVFPLISKNTQSVYPETADVGTEIVVKNKTQDTQTLSKILKESGVQTVDKPVKKSSLNKLKKEIKPKPAQNTSGLKTDPQTEKVSPSYSRKKPASGIYSPSSDTLPPQTPSQQPVVKTPPVDPKPSTSHQPDFKSIQFQPSTTPKLWEGENTRVVNFPPKKQRKLKIQENHSSSHKGVVSTKRKSSFPESRRKKFKTELAGKRKSGARSSRFPEILPKKQKTVRSRVSVLNPTQINSQWASSSEDDD